MKKFTTIKTLLVGLLACAATSAWGASALTKDFEVTGYEAVNLFDFQNYDFDGTAITSFNELPSLGVTAQNTVGSEYGNNNWYDDTTNKRGLRLQSGGGRWIQFTVDIKTDDYIIINGGSAKEAYEISMTDGTSVTVAEASDYLCFKATADATNLKLTVHRYNFLLQILIMRKSASAETADYVINYKYDNETIATDEGNAVVGSTVNVESVKWNNDVKYFLDDEVTNFTIASSGNTFDVNVRMAEAYNFTVNSKAGESTTELASGSAYEGENVYFYVPYFVYTDGKFYQSPNLSSGNLSYGQGTISNIGANTEITVTYTEEESSNVVFFSEAEELTGVTPYEDGFTNVRMSNGKVGYYETQSTFITLPAGIYTLTTASRSGTTTFYAGGKEIGSISSTGAVTETTSAPFTLTAETDIYSSTGGKDTYFDYVIIRKTGDVELPANVTVEVSEAGWATLFTDFALNFEGTGLTAYTATLSESTVTLTEVTSVTAGTGVVLKGEANTYEIPIIDGSDTAKGDLKGNATTATEANGTQYVLMMNGSNAQFTKATSGSIAAGKAYLEKAESESRILNVVFAGEATGIKAIETAKADGNVYNMAGQRVAAPQKGLFIMNGKKVIIK